jgi:hypothetical protein
MSNGQCIDILKERLRLMELLKKLNEDSQIHYTEKKLIENEMALRNYLLPHYLNQIFKIKYSYVFDQQQMNHIKLVLNQLQNFNDNKKRVQFG